MQEINLPHLFKYYASKWQFIAISTLVGLLLGIIYTIAIQTPLYQSTAKLILVSSPTAQTSDDQTIRINDYINLMQSRKVLKPVVDEKQTDMSLEQLSHSIKATNQRNTGVIDLVVSSSDGEQSKNIANSITISFKNAISELYKNDNVLIVDTAVKADHAYNVHVALQLAVTSAAGLLIPIVIMFFIYDPKKVYTVNTASKKSKSTPTSYDLKKKVDIKKSTPKKKKTTVVKAKTSPKSRKK